MNEDNLEPLSPLARSLVEQEKRRPNPVQVAEDRVFGRLSQTLGLIALLPTPVQAPTPVHAPLVAAAGAGALSKALVGVALLSVGTLAGGGAVRLRHQREVAALRAEIEALKTAARASVTAPPEQARPLTVAPLELSVPSTRAHRREAPRVPAVAEVDALHEESTLLERARTALLRRDPPGALTALEEHAHSHPRGRLSEERDALWVQVLVQLQRRPEAIGRAREFREKYPHSLMQTSVDAAVNSAP